MLYYVLYALVYDTLSVGVEQAFQQKKFDVYFLMPFDRGDSEVYTKMVHSTHKSIFGPNGAMECKKVGLRE